MPDDPKAQDVLAPAAKSQHGVQGDLPKALRLRYYTDGRGRDGLDFYVDTSVQTPAFRDRGRELVANRLDPNAIHDMTTIAQHRGWSIVTTRGSADFRREAWLAGRSIGLEVRGYRPTERDVQELQRRQNRRLRAEDRGEVRYEHSDKRHNALKDERDVRRERPDGNAAYTQLHVIGVVVKARIADPKRQEATMTIARRRIADWLERGAQFEPMRSISAIPHTEAGEPRPGLSDAPAAR